MHSLLIWWDYFSEGVDNIAAPKKVFLEKELGFNQQCVTAAMTAVCNSCVNDV